MKKICSAFNLLICLFSINILSAQSVWKKCPLPITTEVRHIVFSAPGIVVIGTSDGVFWSDDLGDHWNSSNQNLPDKNIHAIIALPPRILIVATDAGVYLSDNLGKEWRRSQQPFFSKNIREFEMDYGEVVYAATSEGVWNSDDKGETWHAGGLQNTDLLSIAAGVNGELLAGASRNGTDGIYHTLDFGLNWEKVVDQIMGVNELIIIPHGYFAGTYSHDPLNSNVLKFNASNSKWEEKGLINCSVSCFTYSTYPHMFAGIEEKNSWPDTSASYGVQYSPDAGVHWNPINEGLTDRSVLSMFSFWDDLFAGTSTGLFKRSIQSLTAVHNQNTDELRLICLPAGNNFILKSKNTIEKLEWSIVDLYGNNLLKNIETNFTSKEFHLNDFATGNYFLRTANDHFNKVFHIAVIK